MKRRDAGGIARRSRDFVDDCFEERKQVLRIVADLAVAPRRLVRWWKNNGKSRSILGGVEVD